MNTTKQPFTNVPNTGPMKPNEKVTSPDKPKSNPQPIKSK